MNKLLQLLELPSVVGNTFPDCGHGDSVLKKETSSCGEQNLNHRSCFLCKFAFEVHQYDTAALRVYAPQSKPVHHVRFSAHGSIRCTGTRARISQHQEFFLVPNVAMFDGPSATMRALNAFH